MCIAGRGPDRAEARPVRTTPRLRRTWGERRGDLDRRPRLTSARLERQLTTWPPPSPGRGTYGGCFDWLPDGSAVVYAATTARCGANRCPGGAAGAADRRRPRSPGRRAGGRPGRLVRRRTSSIWPRCGCSRSTGRRAAGSTTASTTSAPTRRSTPTSSIGHVPGVERARHAVGRRRGGDRRRRRRRRGRRSGRTARAVQQPRFAPDGTPMRVHDGTGWLQVWWGDRPLVAGGEPVEHADPSWGQGQASYAVAPDGRRVAFTRNERGFGRLCVADVDTTAPSRRSPGDARPAVVAGRPAGRAAHRRPDTDAGRRLRHRHVGTPSRRRRTGRRLGRRRRSSSRSPSRSTTTATTLHARRYCSPRTERRSAPARDAPRRADRPVAGDVHAAARVLGRPGLGRPGARPPRLDRPRPGLPAGAPRPVGRARRRRHRGVDRPRPRLRLVRAGAHRRDGRLVRRLHRARRARAASRPGRRRGRPVPRDRPRRPGRPQPPVRGPLDRAARRSARATPSCTPHDRPRSLVGRIVDPLLVLHGTADPVVPGRGHDRLRRRDAGGRRRRRAAPVRGRGPRVPPAREPARRVPADRGVPGRVVPPGCRAAA